MNFEIKIETIDNWYNFILKYSSKPEKRMSSPETEIDKYSMLLVTTPSVWNHTFYKENLNRVDTKEQSMSEAGRYTNSKTES